MRLNTPVSFVKKLARSNSNTGPADIFLYLHRIPRMLPRRSSGVSQPSAWEIRPKRNHPSSSRAAENSTAPTPDDPAVEELLLQQENPRCEQSTKFEPEWSSEIELSVRTSAHAFDLPSASGRAATRGLAAELDEPAVVDYAVDDGGRHLVIARPSPTC